MRLRSRFGVALLSLGMLFVLACISTATLAAQASYQQRFIDAKNRWKARPLNHYRLVSESGRACMLDVEVRDEQVVNVFRRDRCLHPARTVTDLFNLIERGQFSYSCVFSGCACSMDIIVYATYDAEFGYPQRIAVRSERASNWWDPSFWQYTWEEQRLPPCARSGEAEMVRILSLTPIQ